MKKPYYWTKWENIERHLKEISVDGYMPTTRDMDILKK